eukprot:SAG22_NODE_7686_length_717_cov_1.011327_1_plen_125_part_01
MVLLAAAVAAACAAAAEAGAGGGTTGRGNGPEPVVALSSGAVQHASPRKADDDVPAVTVTVSESGVAAGGRSPSPSSHPTIPEAQRHVRGLRAAGIAGEIVLDIAGTHPAFSVGRQDSGLHATAR